MPLWRARESSVNSTFHFLLSPQNSNTKVTKSHRPRCHAVFDDHGSSAPDSYCVPSTSCTFFASIQPSVRPLLHAHGFITVCRHAVEHFLWRNLSPAPCLPRPQITVCCHICNQQYIIHVPRTDLPTPPPDHLPPLACDLIECVNHFPAGVGSMVTHLHLASNHVPLWLVLVSALTVTGIFVFFWPVFHVLHVSLPVCFGLHAPVSMLTHSRAPWTLYEQSILPVGRPSTICLSLLFVCSHFFCFTSWFVTTESIRLHTHLSVR